MLHKLQELGKQNLPKMGGPEDNENNHTGLNTIWDNQHLEFFPEANL